MQTPPQQPLDPIVLFDIEANHLEANFGHVLSFGFKPLHGKTKVLSIRDYKLFRSRPWDDSALLSDVYDILSIAGAWVTYYGARFDVPFLQSRMLHHDMPALPPVSHIDLWRTARNTLKIHSRRLGVVAHFLHCTAEKTVLEPEIWEMASSGNNGEAIKALHYIEDHNAADVDVLEEVYVKLLPHINWHPLRTTMPRGKACESCGSTSLRKEGTIVGRRGTRQRFVCRDCGTWGHYYSSKVSAT